MSYDPILREAMKEIKDILKKYDIGGYISLSSPTHGEFSLELEPKWSMIRWMREDAAHIKLHMKSAPEKTDATVGMIARQQEMCGRTFLMLDEIMNQIKNHAEVESKPLEITNEDRL